MVIDLTRKPVFINTDVCGGWFVIRTAANAQVDGMLRRRLEKNELRKGRLERKAGNGSTLVVPEAGIERPDRNLLETRLPVGHILYRKKDEPIPNPFEVATLYVDAFTQKQGSWRVQLILERWQNKNGDLWLVTVRDEGTKTDLVAVTMKSAQVELNALMAHDDDLLPLQRVTKLGLGQERPNVWNRLLGPAFPPLELGLSFEDEDPSS